MRTGPLRCYMCRDFNAEYLVTRDNLQEASLHGRLLGVNCYLVCRKCRLGRFTHDGSETTFKMIKDAFE